MLCKIADLIVELPEAGDLVPRCKEYLYGGTDGADIIIRTELFRPELYPQLSENNMIYMESGNHFYTKILRFDGFYIHASAVAVDGRAYLFSGSSGTGKSTHTHFWKMLFDEKAKIFNDDKPALRYIDGVWYAYGTPWCGKDGININMKVPLAGICFLKQGSENKMRLLTKQETLAYILPQVFSKFDKVELLDMQLAHLDIILRQIPVFELENRPEPAAAQLSYETMRKAAEELGL